MCLRLLKCAPERFGQKSGPPNALQARAVIDGLPADIAALSLPLDIMKIADAGLMRKARCGPGS